MKKIILLLFISISFTYADMSDLELSVKSYETDEYKNSVIESSIGLKIPLYSDGDLYKDDLESEEKKYSNFLELKNNAYFKYIEKKEKLVLLKNFLIFEEANIKHNMYKYLFELSQNQDIDRDKSIHDNYMFYKEKLDFYNSLIKGKSLPSVRVDFIKKDDFLKGLVSIKELSLKSKIDTYKAYSNFSKHELNIVASQKFREEKNDYHQVGLEYKYKPLKNDNYISKARKISFEYRKTKENILIKNSLFYDEMLFKIKELDFKIRSLLESSSWEFDTKSGYKKKVSAYENKAQKADVEILKVEKQLLLLELYKKVLH